MKAALRILAIVLLASLAMVGRADDTLQPGDYVLGRDVGTLTVQPAFRGTQVFSISVVGANAHTCELGGKIKGGRSTPDDQDQKPLCEVRFEKSGPSSLSVKTNEADSCRSYCGARAWFEGTYVLPPSGCSSAEIRRSRDAFKKAYDRHDHAEAERLLSPMLVQCKAVMSPWDEDWIRNDLALAQHKLGRDAACLELLAPLAKDAQDSERDPQAWKDNLELPPVESDIYAGIIAATRTNLKLCRGRRK
ncbi:hypothetical protein [Piscinibacter terrae]|uniref:Secreted protein n=1 Tax=Piscinibacter terrae TaxID=2496871 RepID=A0A3N7JUI9_9BURK|nr:hypothetical protein [Albitalea terrae]RQP24559.1 hypothetical protein DZC73_14860 [Albitalea terrae]